MSEVDKPTAHRWAPVLKAVAYPATLLWVPPQLFVLNVAGSVVPVLIGVIFFDISILWFVPPLIGGHIFFAIKSSRNKHFVHAVVANATRRNTKTIRQAPTKATRYAA